MTRTRPNHHYTVSPAAKTKLIELFAAARQQTSTRRREWGNRPEIIIDAFGRPTPITTTASQRTASGITHALIQLHRTYDLTDYFPKPTIPMYLTIPGTKALFYNPADELYLAEARQDDTPWDDLPNWEREDRLKELQRRRGWGGSDSYVGRGNVPGLLHKNRLAGIGNLHLSLPNDTRRYYHNLRLFHNIPLLPGCRTPNNLTASISTVLEAIGTGHLELPADYIYAISTPNKRLARHSQYTSQDGKRKFGNHAHTAYIQKEWRALPKLSAFTQADVDYCCRSDNLKSLGDLALEAISLNPQLQLPPDSPAHTTPVSADQLSPTTQRAKPHIDLVPTTPTHDQPILYKGRDVSACINLAISAHYGEDKVSFPKLAPLATEHGLPLYMLQRLATREWVRRTLAESEESASDYL